MLDWYVHLNQWCQHKIKVVESPDLYKLNLMVKSCCFDWTLCAVLNRWNMRVARTLQHRQRSYSILQKINQKFIVGQIIGKLCLAIFGFCLCRGGCFESMMSTWNKSGRVSGFVQIEFDGDILSFWLDALCCAEPLKPESGQYPTTQTKVLLDSPKNQPEIHSWTNNRQAMLCNILVMFM